MKSGRLFTRTCCLLGFLLSTACGSRTEKASPDYPEFKMIVRLWPDHHKDSALREELLQALKKYPDFCDEVWLCMEFETFSKEAHKESARAMAVAARTAAECGHRRVDTGNNARSRGRFRIGSSAAPPGAHMGQYRRRAECPDRHFELSPPAGFPRLPRRNLCPVRRAMPAVLHMAGRRLARHVSRSGAAALFLRYLPQPVQPAARGALDPGNAGRGAGQERRGRPAAAAMDIVLPAEPRRGSPDCRADRPRGFARHPDGLAACQFSPRTHGRTGLEPDARRAGGRDRTGPGLPGRETDSTTTTPPEACCSRDTTWPARSAV